MTAQTAADLIGLPRNRAVLFYHKLREQIACKITEIDLEFGALMRQVAFGRANVGTVLRAKSGDRDIPKVSGDNKVQAHIVAANGQIKPETEVR